MAWPDVEICIPHWLLYISELGWWGICTHGIRVRSLWFSLILHIKVKKSKSSIVIEISFDSAIFTSNSSVFSLVQSDAITYCLGSGKLVNATQNICFENKNPLSALVYTVKPGERITSVLSFRKLRGVMSAFV